MHLTQKQVLPCAVGVQGRLLEVLITRDRVEVIAQLGGFAACSAVVPNKRLPHPILARISPSRRGWEAGKLATSQRLLGLVSASDGQLMIWRHGFL